MKKIIVVFLFLCFGLSSEAQFYIRYNHLGYSPKFEKQLVILSDEDLANQSWFFKSKDSIVLEGKISEPFCQKGFHTPFSYNYTVDFSSLKEIGDYSFTLKDSSIKFRIDTNLYSFIPSDILYFFRAQRSGSKECVNHKISHKGDKSCVIHRRKSELNSDWGYLDYLPKKVNMLGGWYDAGDYIKFTLTTAYSSYLLLKAYELNPELFQTKKYSQTERNDLLDETSWALDYLLKTYQDTSEFIIQVGGHRDHQQGDRLPEHDELNGKREAYSAFSPTQMAYTVASLALGARIFQTVDSTRAAAYKKQAIAIYKKARTLEECYWVKQGWEEFYADKTPFDNLLLAASELYFLTQENKYLEDVLIFQEKAGQGYWSSWSNCNLLAHSVSKSSDYAQKDLIYFQKIANETNNVWKLPHKYTWGSLYSFLGVANGALLNKIQNTDETFDSEIYNVLDYTLGKNNWGMAFICSDSIENAACNTYSQIYKLQPKITPVGAVAEGPGDRATHEQLKQYFKIPKEYPSEKFNSGGTIFYNLNTNFQTMESTIVGEAEALLFFSLIDKIEKTR